MTQTPTITRRSKNKTNNPTNTQMQTPAADPHPPARLTEAHRLDYQEGSNDRDHNNRNT